MPTEHDKQDEAKQLLRDLISLINELCIKCIPPKGLTPELYMKVTDIGMRLKRVPFETQAIQGEET